MNKFDSLVRTLPEQSCSLQAICSEDIPEQPTPVLHMRFLDFTPPPHVLVQEPNVLHVLHRPTAVNENMIQKDGTT